MAKQPGGAASPASALPLSQILHLQMKTWDREPVQLSGQTAAPARRAWSGPRGEARCSAAPAGSSSSRPDAPRLCREFGRSRTELPLLSVRPGAQHARGHPRGYGP